MTQTAVGRSSPITGWRVVGLIIVWLALVYIAAPAVGLYYEVLATFYVVPTLGLIYAYCVSHRRRATAYLAIAATLIALLILGFAMVFPKGSAA